MKMLILLSALGLLLTQSPTVCAQMKLPPSPTEDRCATLKNEGAFYAQNFQKDMAYDTLRAYIEQCYADTLSYGAFISLSEAVGPDSNGQWLDFRNWLFKVLYYNRDMKYYCADVQDLFFTFNYDDPRRGIDNNGALAVGKYIIESGKCPDLAAELANGWARARQKEYTFWQDTVRDSMLTPWSSFDTTLPSLMQIGFELLLGPQNGFVPFNRLPQSVLGSVGATPNPFNKDAEITYTLNVPATLTVDVFDALGARVRTLLPSRFVGQGARTLTVDGFGLASGTYYVRFSVPEGEVRTVKIVKE